jgi:hypothetical protein
LGNGVNILKALGPSEWADNKLESTGAFREGVLLKSLSFLGRADNILKALGLSEREGDMSESAKDFGERCQYYESAGAFGTGGR